MNKIMTYNDIYIYVMRRTLEPDALVQWACSITQKKQPDSTQNLKTANLIKYLVQANHTSVFEHATISFMIYNVSRSLLAQLTRHRMGSFTSASQHYTKYDSHPCVIKEGMQDLKAVEEFFDQADEMYNWLISIGTPKEDARQVLPNAKAVSILWTTNARSLINFFNQRLCRRNVQEMYNFADGVYSLCCNWFPELFKYVGPDCEMLGGCRQGKMKAKECIDNGIPNFRS